MAPAQLPCLLRIIIQEHSVEAAYFIIGCICSSQNVCLAIHRQYQCNLI